MKPSILPSPLDYFRPKPRQTWSKAPARFPQAKPRLRDALPPPNTPMAPPPPGATGVPPSEYQTYGGTIPYNQAIRQQLAGYPQSAVQGLADAVHTKDAGGTHSALAAMFAAPSPPHTETLNPLMQSMFPVRPPTTITPERPAGSFDYQEGRVLINPNYFRSIPAGVAAHEYAHAGQHLPSKEWADAVDRRRRQNPALYEASAELAPGITGMVAEAEARRRAGREYPRQLPVRFPSGYAPSVEWMRGMAARHGAFRGVPIEKLIAENPQWVRTLVQNRGS